MNWQILMILQCFLIAASVLMMRRLAGDSKTRHAAFAINAGQYIVQYVVGLLFIASLSGAFQPVLQKYWALFLLQAINYALVNIFTYKMLNHVDAAIGTIISTVNSLTALVGAALVLNETITWQQAFGAVLLLASVTYGVQAARTKTSSSQQHHVSRGLIYGLLVAVCFGIAAVTEKYLLQQMNLKTYLVYGWGSQVAFSIAIALIIQPKAFQLFRQARIRKIGLTMGLTRALGGLCFLTAIIKTNNVGLMTLISNFRLILVVSLAAIFLGERSKLVHKFAAAGLAVAALSLMF